MTKEDGTEKESHIVIEFKHPQKINEKQKVDWYPIIHVFLIIINLGIAYWGHQNNLEWQKNQQEISTFDPYTRITSEVIYLDTHHISQGIDDNYLFFKGSPKFTITVITPMLSVIELNQVTFNRSSNSIENKYDSDNNVYLNTPFIEELPSGLSRITTELTLSADFRIKE